MRDITIIGRVVNDAQLKQTKNGLSFIEFRFANNEHSDPEGYTYWFRVVSFQPNCINRRQYFTKGKPLFVQGRYSDRLYTTQSGATEIGRDITAHTIEFIDFGGRQENGTVQTKTEEVTSGPVIPPVTEHATVPASKPVQNVTVKSDDSDDLPF